MACYKYLLGIIPLFFMLLPLDVFAQELRLDERRFEVIQKYGREKFKGTEVRGKHKRFRRAEHHLESRLNEKGNLFNYTKANMDALQRLYIDTFPATIQGEWEHVGPLNTTGNDFNQEGVGRVNCIAFASAGTWYAGTAGGGLWRTDIGGIYVGGDIYPWIPLTDSLPVMSISGISVNPNDVDDVFILTGDGESTGTFASRGTQPGIGILHSIDGGISWDTTALQYGVNSLNAGYKLARYPGSIDTMFAACTDALYRTTDAWQSQAAMTQPIPGTTCFDVEFKPNDPQTIYAACAGSLQRSTDGGANFTDITANMQQANITPNSLITRMAIAVTPDDPNYLYVVMAQNNGGLLSFQVSSDGGNTFFETNNGSTNILSSDEASDSGGQGNYDLAIWADPNNEMTVIVGGVNIWKSNSSGALWSKIVDWKDEPPEYTHADIHALETNPFSGSLIAGTDGGLYSSTDGGLEWLNRGKGLGVTQYYHLDVYTGFLGIPFVAGGAQDNGTSVGFGIYDPVFEMIGGGDGFRTFRGNDDGDAVRYVSVQNGKLYRHEYSAVLELWVDEVITPENEENEDGTGRGVWDTPYEPSVNDINSLVAGYDDLYYSGDGGDDWAQIDYPAGSGYDGSEMITELQWSNASSNVLYIFTADGSKRDLYKCEAFLVAAITGTLENGLCTVVNLDTVSSMPINNISDIALNPYDDTPVWLSFPNYTDSMKVFYNPDMTVDTPWINISYNLPNVPVHCVEWDVDGLFAGTDIGAFYLPHGEEEWIYFSQGLPTVAVTEIEVRNTIVGKLIYASTWGRGIWWTTPPTPIRRTRWYVDQDAVGLNNGANWTNAFSDLQTALDTIQPGDSIWVADGIYKPATVDGFSLGFDNVRIWGGFNATENLVSQRDFETNVAILSGDIGIEGDSLDNANHVFVFGGHNGNVLLDGFHITEGYAHDPDEDSKGAGIYYSTGVLNGKPIVTNCKIYNNSAKGGSGLPNHHGHGAGMYIADYDSGDPDMYVIDCTFENNRSLERGGGIYIDAYKNDFPLDTGTAVVHIEGCSFVNNKTVWEGGAIGLEAVQSSTVKLFIDSTTFNGNSLTYFKGDGAAIYCNVNSSTGGNLELEISNSEFKNNVAITATDGQGGAIYIDGAGALTTSTFTNCAFENNSAGVGGAITTYGTGAATHAILNLEDCSFNSNDANSGGAIQFNSINQALTETHFVNCDFDSNTVTGRGGAIQYNGESGHFISYMDSCTFTNNQASENGAIRFYSRAQTGPSSFDADVSNSLFVNNSSSGFTSGGALAFYNDRGQVDASFLNTDFVNNSTGTLGGAAVHTHIINDTSYLNASYSNCDFTDNNTLIGNGNLAGGALASIRTDLAVNNCNFNNNESKYGGAIYNQTIFNDESYSYTFSNCQFNNNHSTTLAGAIYNSHSSPSEMLVDITDCVFDSNYVTSVNAGDGGAIYTSGTGRSVQNISNTSFIDNSAKKNGGAIYITNGSSLTDSILINIDNCTFTNNDANNTSETIEIFGNGTNARIFTTWTDTDFYNDETNTMFLNRVSQTGISKATFHNCFLYIIGGQQPPPIVLPLYKGVVNERSP